MPNIIQIALLEILFLEAVLLIFLLALLWKSRKKPKFIIKTIKTQEKTENHTIIKLTKILAFLIPITLLLFIIYSNFIVSCEFNNFYDIGSEKDANKPYLTPLARISDVLNSSSNNSDKSQINYRNITQNLAYFDAPILRSSDNLDLSVRFQDITLNNSAIYLGAKNAENWSYSKNLLYSSSIERLIEEYPYKTEEGFVLITLNPEFSQNYSIKEFLKNPPKAKIATYGLEQELSEGKTIIENYNPGELVIDTAMRGSANLYVYVKGDLELEVWKKDLNWYANKDELTINVYDDKKKLIASETIKDDGIEKISKEPTLEQSGKISAKGLEEGVYRIELKSNNDLVINQIKLNQNKIVADSPVLYNTQYKIDDYHPNEKIITDALRGSHTFYVYAKDYIRVEIWKRDLNWAEGKDEMTMNLYDLEGRIIKSAVIPDDGITGKKTNKSNTNDQSTRISTGHIDEGLYKLELKTTDDVIITKIKINQDKIVGVGNVFLASSNAYFNDLNKTTNLYFSTSEKIKKISTITYHKDGLQTISIDKDNLSISNTSISYSFTAERAGKAHKLTSSKNDIKISGMEAYSFGTGEKKDSNLDWYKKTSEVLYFRNKDSCTLNAETSHNAGKQVITINSLYLQVQALYQKNSKKIPYSPEIYSIRTPNGDIKITGCGNLFSFTSDSWFDPFAGNKFSYKEDYNYLKEKVDLILAKYTPTKIQDGWITAQTSFNLKDLYIKDNKLNMMLDIPHLTKNETAKYSVSVDWINATVQKNGII